MIQAIAFDAYGTLFDVYSVGAAAEAAHPGKGAELAQLWRLKQIEYTQLRTLSGRYEPFWELTRDALVFALRKLTGDAPGEVVARLMDAYAHLGAFPENLGALRELKALGLPLAILSNGTPQMLAMAVSSAGMDGLFEHVLSVDRVQRYKTAPEAYQLGPDAFNLPANRILFVSSNGWDACGATWFGYTTFWINRSGQPAEELDVAPSAVGSRLTDVVDFVRQRQSAART
jgi:2-haloacid dehalogenase